MPIVVAERRYRDVFVAETGCEFDNLEDAYHHVACWRITMDNEVHRVRTGERRTLGDCHAVIGRLARYLRFLDHKKTD